MFIEVTNSLDRLTDQSAITASLKDMPDYANMDISSAVSLVAAYECGFKAKYFRDIYIMFCMYG